MINDLAAKLGTTAEHLWAVLIRQAPISASTDILLLIASGVALWFALRIISRGMKGLEESYNNEGTNMAILLFGGVACIVSCILAVNLLLSLGMILAGFFNPEYWALKQIIN